MNAAATSQVEPKGVEAVLFREDAPAECVVLEPGKNGSFLGSMQDCVKGLVDFLDVLELDGGPTLWVNDEGMLNGMRPNRVLYASQKMQDAGYLSQIDGHPVRASEPYAVIFGPILAVGKDDEGNPRDITPEEFSVAGTRLGGPESGARMVARLKAEAMIEELLSTLMEPAQGKAAIAEIRPLALDDESSVAEKA